MYYIGPVVTWFVRQRINQVRMMIDNPLDSQWNTFRYLITNAMNTEWGFQYEYDSIESYEDFKNRVPIQDYDSLKPYINRIINGEQNVLWSSPITWFAKSSGTTNDVSKFIPVTKESLEDCHYKGSIDLLTMYCNSHESTNIFSGKGLILGGSHEVNQLNGNSSYGDLSAVLLQNMSFIAQLYRTPDLSIALMSDWEKKIEQLAQATKNENVTNISGVPTWIIILIKRLFDLTGKKSLKEVWPGLELYIHGGVSFTPYKNQFKALIQSDEVKYLETYNASEGFFAFTDDINEKGMVLHTNAGILYEFIPQSDWYVEDPKTVMLNEVKLHENYALVISTNAGLWRYKVGDTVRFISLNPYRLEVTGRVKHFINAFGEEVIVDNADKAIANTCIDTHAKVTEYTVAPVYLSINNKGCHEWFIEFETLPNDMAKFTHILDSELRKINSDYDAKRTKDIALSEPIINILPHNTFYNWLKLKGKLGGQHKVPRLSNNRIYVEEIISLVESV